MGDSLNHNTLLTIENHDTTPILSNTLAITTEPGSKKQFFFRNDVYRGKTISMRVKDFESRRKKRGLDKYYKSPSRFYFYLITSH